MTKTEILQEKLVVPCKYFKTGRIENFPETTKELTPRVKIDPKGRFIFADEESKMRAAYLKEKLGRSKIQVLVVERAKEWEDFVNSLASDRMILYQPITHPDFSAFHVARGSERLEMIAADAGDVKGKNVLDVGSCLGYFARWFDQKGAQVEAVEGHRPFFNACNKLNEVKGTAVKYYRKDIRDWLKSKGAKKEYDIIVCLSVIHNIAQAGDSAAAVKVLQQLSEKSPVLYFDIGHVNEGKSLTKTSLPKRLISEDPAEVAKYIKENTCYKNVALIGETSEYSKRKLYKFTR